MKTTLDIDPSLAKTRDKLLVLHICNSLSDDDFFGAIKLNKALYFIDIASYMESGHYISSFRYVKQDMGPTPDGKFLALKEELIKGGLLIEEIHNYGSFKVKKPVCVSKDFDLEVFSDEERNIIEEVIKMVRQESAAILSEFTHNLGWEKTKKMHELNPVTYLLTNDPLLPSEEAFFKREVARMES